MILTGKNKKVKSRPLYLFFDSIAFNTVLHSHITLLYCHHLKKPEKHFQ